MDTDLQAFVNQLPIELFCTACQQAFEVPYGLMQAKAAEGCPSCKSTALDVKQESLNQVVVSLQQAFNEIVNQIPQALS